MSIDMFFIINISLKVMLTEVFKMNIYSIISCSE